MALFLKIGEFDAKTVGEAKGAKAGKAQLQIESHESKKAGSFSLKLRVLAHEDPDSVGKHVFDYYQLEGKGAERTAALLIETGVISKQQLITAQESGQDGGGFDPNVLLQRVFFATLAPNTYQGKTSIRVGWAIYGENHPEVAIQKFPYAPSRVPAAVKNAATNSAAADAASRVREQSKETVPF